jgi:hypothetical protein
MGWVAAGAAGRWGGGGSAPAGDGSSALALAVEDGLCAAGASTVAGGRTLAPHAEQNAAASCSSAASH